MKEKNLFLLIGIIAFLNCAAQDSEPYSKNNKNFKLEYILSGGKSGMTGEAKISIDGNKINYNSDYKNGYYPKKDTSFYISDNAKDSLIQLIIRSGFFSLNKNYSNDGRSHYIFHRVKISIDDKKNEVHVKGVVESPVYEILYKLLEFFPFFKKAGY